MIKLILISVVFGSMVALAALICGTVLLIAKMRSKDGSPRGGDREEARIIQEIYKGLDNMENRIESLEVILSENTQAKSKAEQQGGDTI